MGRRPAPPRDPIYCGIPGCDYLAKHLVKKLCQAHYMRFRIYGDPLAGGPEVPSRRAQFYTHGTIRGYTDFGCRCADCREANRLACKAARLKRLARPIPDHVHGTMNGYNSYACRCEPCMQAKQEYQRSRV